MRYPTKEYTTRDSGERTEFDSGMVRDISYNKPNFNLILPKGIRYEEQMLTRFAELLTRGGEKYTPRNWEQANSEEELERFKESAFRHLIQWLTGADDEDHASAVIFNILAHETTETKILNSDEVEYTSEELNRMEESYDGMQ